MTREADDVIEGLASMCRKYETTCLIDVGSCEGYEASKLPCRSICIDPDRRVTFCPGMDCYRDMIGATDCVTTFYQHSNLGMSGALHRDGVTEGYSVSQYRLDSFCSDHQIVPDALIVDTEGTTLDVLEGCGALLDGIKFIYAECQSELLFPGVRLVGEVDNFLAMRGFTQHIGPPAYFCGGQGNYCWVRK